MNTERKITTRDPYVAQDLYHYALSLLDRAFPEHPFNPGIFTDYSCKELAQMLRDAGARGRSYKALAVNALEALIEGACVTGYDPDTSLPFGHESICRPVTAEDRKIQLATLKALVESSEASKKSALEDRKYAAELAKECEQLKQEIARLNKELADPTPAAPTPSTLDNMVNRAPLRGSGCVNHPREEADATTAQRPMSPEKTECRQCGGEGSIENPDREEAQFTPLQPCYHCRASGACGCDFCTLAECDECWKPISTSRVKARPLPSLCVECHADRDREHQERAAYEARMDAAYEARMDAE